MTGESLRFEGIADHGDLRAWSRAYAREARREWGLDVRLDLVEWAVSTRAKRRAAAVKRPVLDGASVGDPMDWASVPDADGRPLPCTVVLTWAAAQSYDRAEWAATVRHELLHVEQFQAYGTTDHGPAFRRRAERLDTSVRCDHFAEPRFTFHCVDCGTEVARRFRDCPFVREYRSYRSDCCGSPLERRERD